MMSRGSGRPCLLHNIAGCDPSAQGGKVLDRLCRAASPGGGGSIQCGARSGGANKGTNSNLAALLLQLQLLEQPRIHLARLRGQQHASTYATYWM